MLIKPPPGVRKSNKNAARNEPAFLLDFRTKGGGFPNQTKDFLTGEVKKWGKSPRILCNFQLLISLVFWKLFEVCKSLK